MISEEVNVGSMTPQEEINNAIKEAQEGRLFSNPLKDFVFEPISKGTCVIRHMYESEETLNRYREYLQRHGIKDITNFPRKFLTKAGTYVRSKAELIIANTLTDLNLKYYYEPLLDFGKFFRKPDFYLPQLDLIYEHFGKDDEKYTQMMERKKRLFAKHNMLWIYTTAKDEADVKEALRRKIREVRHV